jgi:vitamin B12 transporter
VVEKTLAWLNQNCRLSKDDEELPSTSETFGYVAMTRLMLKRLAAWYFSNRLSEKELEPVIITATVAPTLLGRTTVPVTIIAREQIAAQQATGATELLRQVPGIHIDQAGACGGISSVYVRGSNPNFTVLRLMESKSMILPRAVGALLIFQ